MRGASRPSSGSLQKIRLKASYEMEGAYEAAIDKAKKIIKDKLRTGVNNNPQLERIRQLAEQRRGLHKQATKILNRVKEELEEVEITQSRGSLRSC